MLPQGESLKLRFSARRWLEAFNRHRTARLWLKSHTSTIHLSLSMTLCCCTDPHTVSSSLSCAFLLFLTPTLCPPFTLTSRASLSSSSSLPSITLSVLLSFLSSSLHYTTPLHSPPLPSPLLSSPLLSSPLLLNFLPSLSSLFLFSPLPYLYLSLHLALSLIIFVSLPPQIYTPTHTHTHTHTNSSY